MGFAYLKCSILDVEYKNNYYDNQMSFSNIIAIITISMLLIWPIIEQKASRAYATLWYIDISYPKIILDRNIIIVCAHEVL